MNANRIRGRREELCKTQRQMAIEAGIGVSTWANYENGHQDRASTQTLQKVARALRLDLDDVVDTRPRPEPIPRPPGPPKDPEQDRPPNKPGVAARQGKGRARAEAAG
ncbi:hypothetical protein Lesp02_84370 [Lentzea sp. NBRC 105346]|nr:hypothetical protein Lesp02_84370 [Lentzea sp. NBRC 105346]